MYIKIFSRSALCTEGEGRKKNLSGAPETAVCGPGFVSVKIVALACVPSVFCMLLLFDGYTPGHEGKMWVGALLSDLLPRNTSSFGLVSHVHLIFVIT